MTRFKAWPFLVTSNQKTDYKVVVAPDFIVERNQIDLLTHLTGRPTEKAIYEEYTSNLGTISIFYRVVFAKYNENILKDLFGRPILWIEGFVLRETAKNYDMTVLILNVAHSYIEEAFQDFWNNNTKLITQSKAIDINLDLIRDKGRPTTVLPWYIRHKNDITLVCFLIAILLAGVWLFMSPRLEIIQPHESEDLRIGEIYEIKWKSTGVDKGLIDIKYSVDGTDTWSNITSDWPNVGDFKWEVPNTPCNECYVLIDARDKGAIIVESLSNKFTISK